MPQERDLFASFERMRREMDELFGDVLDRGPFRRVVSLGAEVDAATYEDGILTVELPLSRPATPRTVPIRGSDK
jgi:HSP20 family molecular chaperone IbpA